MNRSYFSALLATLVVFSSLAQTPLDEVVVSSPRLDVPFSDDSKSVTVITAEQIADTPVSNLVDLLRFQAGVDIRRQGIEGAQADVYLRGGTFDQVLLLIDGIRVDDPQTEIAKKAEVGLLILGHYSSRYKDLGLFVDEAKAVFPNVILAADGAVIS